MNPHRRFNHADYARDARRLARRLLGARLVRLLPSGERLAGIIVETEAYLGIEDRAAHSYAGRRTARVEPMYARAGTAYVYFTYGMHHCFNVVAGKVEEPTAVLVRALHPTEGLDTMRARRSVKRGAVRTLRDIDLCSGPGKVCEALGIDRRHSGIDLSDSDELFIEHGRARALKAARIGVSARIGVGYSLEWASRPLRFFVRNDPNVSR